jgi:hypothetical protein
MWHLIHFSLRRWRSQQQCRINRPTQTDSSLNVATQICDDDMLIPGSPIRPKVSASGRQREVNDTIRMSGYGRPLIKNEWSVRNVVNRSYYTDDFVGARIGIVCHDGSYQFWEWDSKKVRFVPLVIK